MAQEENIVVGAIKWEDIADLSKVTDPEMKTQLTEAFERLEHTETGQATFLEFIKKREAVQAQDHVTSDEKIMVTDNQQLPTSLDTNFKHNQKSDVPSLYYTLNINEAELANVALPSILGTDNQKTSINLEEALNHEIIHAADIAMFDRVNTFIELNNNIKKNVALFEDITNPQSVLFKQAPKDVQQELLGIKNIIQKNPQDLTEADHASFAKVQDYIESTEEYKHIKAKTSELAQDLKEQTKQTEAYAVESSNLLTIEQGGKVLREDYGASFSFQDLLDPEYMKKLQELNKKHVEEFGENPLTREQIQERFSEHMLDNQELHDILRKEKKYDVQDSSNNISQLPIPDNTQPQSTRGV
jgi:hypothetical protein